MFDGDVLVLEPLGLLIGCVQQPRQALGEVDLAGAGAGAGDAGSAAECGLDGGACLVGVGSGRGEQTGYEPFGLVEQGQQQVFAVDLDVPVAHRFGLGVL